MYQKIITHGETKIMLGPSGRKENTAEYYHTKQGSKCIPRYLDTLRM